MAINGQTIESQNNGHFEVPNLPAGSHVYTLSADNFITTTGSVVVTEDASDFHLHMSPNLAANEWRIQVDWEANPRDLDSHIVFGNSNCWEFYYANSHTTCDGVTVYLNRDVTNSDGPEVTTLSNVDRCTGGNTCRWVYRVKNYSGHYDANYGWTESQAVVTLSNGDHEVGHYRVGTDGYTNGDGRGYSSDQFWSVFAIEANGEVTVCANEACT